MDAQKHRILNRSHIGLLILVLCAASCAEFTFLDDPAFGDKTTDSVTPIDTETETATETEASTETESTTSTGHSTDTITDDTAAEDTGTVPQPPCDDIDEVLDTEHDLCWEDPPSTDQVTLTQAEDRCAALRIGGATNWRVPTLSELRTIIANCRRQQDGGACGITDDCTVASICDTDTVGGCDSCNDTDTSVTYISPLLTDIGERFKSSTLDESNPTRGWVVRFENAVFFTQTTTIAGAAVRCVRPSSN